MELSVKKSTLDGLHFGVGYVILWIFLENFGRGRRKKNRRKRSQQTQNVK
jgi:hypothetical protein